MRLFWVLCAGKGWDMWCFMSGWQWCLGKYRAIACSGEEDEGGREDEDNEWPEYFDDGCGVCVCVYASLYGEVVVIILECNLNKHCIY